MDKNTVWRSLENDPPNDTTGCVILFPMRTDCGILYHASNPAYARVNALNQGFTHWMEIPEAPTHKQWREWQEKLRDEE